MIGEKLKTLRLGSINMEPENKKIYINNALLPETKSLLYKTKEQMRIKNWHKTWVYAHDVYILREENGQKIKIRNEEDLQKLTE